MTAPKSLVIDLTKCQWATLCYMTKDNYTSTCCPTWPTVHGKSFNMGTKHFSEDCTLLEYAIKNKLIDIWFPICTFQLSANHTVTYTGDKAITMYDAWKAKIFSQALKKKGKK